MLALPPEIALLPDVSCMYYANKKLYVTADQASCALREVAVKYMTRGCYDPRLEVYACHGHWHIGRVRDKKTPGA